jgi:membrane protein
MSFWRFCKRLYNEYQADGVADSAAQLSYYFVFSLFPFLVFLATLAAYLPLGGSIDLAIDRLRSILPSEAMKLIQAHLHDLVERPRPRLLTLGLAVTVYSASRGIDAVRKALNLSYDVTESRSWWKLELLAIGSTAGGAVLLFAGLALLAAGGRAGFWLADHLGFGWY